MTARADIAIVLVGFNSRPYLSECLKSLGLTDWRGRSHQVVYVDNGSSDGSLEMMRELWPQVTIIANDCNVGFCNACNQGVAATDSRYIYLLNVDVLLFTDSVTLLAEFLDRTPRAAAAGNRLLNADRSDQWSARRFPTWRNALFGRRSWLGRRFPDTKLVRDYLYKDQLERGEPFAVDWVPGSCTLVRREAYELVGGLPAGMHYWSDAVFCDRLRKARWEIFVVPESKLIHFEGNSTGRKSPAIRRWLITDFHRGAYRFYCEHHNLRPHHPVRWVAKLALGLRAGLLVAADLMRHRTRESWDAPESGPSSAGSQDLARHSRINAAAGESHYREALVLAVASPIIAELVSGSAPPLGFFVPWVFALFVLFYGCCAILIRELTLRWGSGWAGILLMGAAFGILQEGCATKAFFDPAWRSLGPLAEHGRWLGVNWIWSVDATLYHAVYSAAIPVLLVYLLFPATRNQLWLGRRTLWVVAALFGMALWVFVRAGNRYPVPTGYLAGCVIVAILLCVAARGVRPRWNATRKGVVSPLWFAALGFGATASLVLQIYVVPQLGSSALDAGMLVGLTLISYRLLRKWSGNGLRWSRQQQYGLLAGALGCFGLMDFFQEFNPTRTDNMRGVSLVGASALVGLLWLAWRLRHADAQDSQPAADRCREDGDERPHDLRFLEKQ